MNLIGKNLSQKIVYFLIREFLRSKVLAAAFYPWKNRYFNLGNGFIHSLCHLQFKNSDENL